MPRMSLMGMTQEAEDEPGEGEGAECAPGVVDNTGTASQCTRCNTLYLYCTLLYIT